MMMIYFVKWLIAESPMSISSSQHNLQSLSILQIVHRLQARFQPTKNQLVLTYWTKLT